LAKRARDRGVGLDAILKDVAASPVLAYRGPFILDGQFRSFRSLTSPCSRRTCARAYLAASSQPVPAACGPLRRDDECCAAGIDGSDFVVAH